MNKQQQVTANDKRVVWKDKDVVKQIKTIYGRGLTDGEWDTFLQIGRATGLNPFLRELWAVKYKDKPAHIFVGRDGYRKSAQSHPDYDCHQVDAVYSNDQFVYDQKTGTVQHRYNFSNRGQLLGAYSLAHRHKSTKPFYVSVQFKEYDLDQALWKTKPETMIKKVAEAQTLRMAFQELFAGTYCESEAFLTEEGGVIPIKSERLKAANEHFGLLDEPEIAGHMDIAPPINIADIGELSAPIEAQKDNNNANSKTQLIERCLNFLIGSNNYAA